MRNWCLALGFGVLIHPISAKICPPEELTGPNVSMPEKRMGFLNRICDELGALSHVLPKESELRTDFEDNIAVIGYMRAGFGNPDKNKISQLYKALRTAKEKVGEIENKNENERKQRLMLGLAHFARRASGKVVSKQDQKATMGKKRASGELTVEYLRGCPELGVAWSIFDILNIEYEKTETPQQSLDRTLGVFSNMKNRFPFTGTCGEAAEEANDKLVMAYFVPGEELTSAAIDRVLSFKGDPNKASSSSVIGPHTSPSSILPAEPKKKVAVKVNEFCSGDTKSDSNKDDGAICSLLEKFDDSKNNPGKSGSVLSESRVAATSRLKEKINASNIEILSRAVGKTGIENLSDEEALMVINALSNIAAVESGDLSNLFAGADRVGKELKQILHSMTGKATSSGFFLSDSADSEAVKTKESFFRFWAAIGGEEEDVGVEQNDSTQEQTKLSEKTRQDTKLLRQKIQQTGERSNRETQLLVQAVKEAANQIEKVKNNRDALLLILGLTHFAEHLDVMISKNTAETCNSMEECATSFGQLERMIEALNLPRDTEVSLSPTEIIMRDIKARLTVADERLSPESSTAASNTSGRNSNGGTEAFDERKKTRQVVDQLVLSLMIPREVSKQVTEIVAEASSKTVSSCIVTKKYEDLCTGRQVLGQNVYKERICPLLSGFSHSLTERNPELEADSTEQLDMFQTAVETFTAAQGAVLVSDGNAKIYVKILNEVIEWLDTGRCTRVKQTTRLLVGLAHFSKLSAGSAFGLGCSEYRGFGKPDNEQETCDPHCLADLEIRLLLPEASDSSTSPSSLVKKWQAVREAACDMESLEKDIKKLVLESMGFEYLASTSK